MSFILDALRKSEGERQRDATPSLSRIPEAVARRRLPLWAAGTIALLGLGVIGLGAALWMTREGQGAPAERDEARLARDGGGAARDDAGFTRDGAASAAVDSATRRGSENLQAQRESPDLGERGESADLGGRRESADPSDERAAANLGARRAAADSAPRPAFPDLQPDRSTPGLEQRGGADEGGAANAPAFLPRYEAAAAADPSLPKLNLEFHAFAADPARRFVYINGEKYAEGSKLGPDLRIARITADGVILEAAGRQLMLPRK